MLRRPREGSLAGQQKTYTVQGTSQNGERGRCTAIFKVQCQEKEPLLAFKNAAGTPNGIKPLTRLLTCSAADGQRIPRRQASTR